MLHFSHISLAIHSAGEVQSVRTSDLNALLFFQKSAETISERELAA
jgi:hypothetical protein